MGVKKMKDLRRVQDAPPAWRLQGHSDTRDIHGMAMPMGCAGSIPSRQSLALHQRTQDKLSNFCM